MNITIIASVAAFLALASLDAWAIVRITKSPLYSRAQRIAQSIFILLVPIAGALLALYLARPQTLASSGAYPTENTDAEDVVFINNYDIGSHN